MPVIYDTISIIGMGLIGSSIALAAKKYGLVNHVVGCARTEDTCKTALELGLAERMELDPVDAVKGADLVILCTPVGTFAQIGEAIAPALKPGATLTDVGSVKKAVVDSLTDVLPADIHFIPGHPVAGTEQSGPTAGFPSLFKKRWCILTPPESGVYQPDLEEGEQALKKLKSFWEGMGSMVEIMTPTHHDLVLAITSHVPHLIAYNIVGTARDLETVTDSEVIKYSAGGFRDFTRIASSDPTMWRDISLANKDAILEMLGRFTEDLSALQRSIRWGDGDALYNFFAESRKVRSRVVEAGQDEDKPNFGRLKNEDDK